MIRLSSVDKWDIHLNVAHTISNPFKAYISNKLFQFFKKKKTGHLYNNREFWKDNLKCKIWPVMPDDQPLFQPLSMQKKKFSSYASVIFWAKEIVLTANNQKKL